MAVSQFTYYTSSDASAPQISGQAGTLLAVLNAICVDGYGTKLAAGWTKPIVDSGNCGCITQGAGAGMSLFINDNGPDGAATFKHAWVTGWESIASVAAPVGTGSGQFPTPAQLLTTGHGVIWKSNAVDSSPRPWICFADASTLYLFIQTGDVANTYYGLMFGDIYSLKLNDPYRCFLACNNSTVSATTGTVIHWAGQTTSPTAGQVGRFMPRTFGGGIGSIAVAVQGDVARSANASNFSGLIQTPNGPDNSIYLSPVVVFETSVGCIRGRLRGFWQVLHPAANFSDGQIFDGAGDYANRTFQIVKPDHTGGYAAIEISNTVETN